MRCFVVRFSPLPEVTRGLGIFQDVAVIASPAGVASRRRPGARLALPPSFPTWGLDPLRRETSTATVAIHASGGRCSTRPWAHAIGPSPFSAVRRQVLLSWPKSRATP